jgi:hypothetical protein
MLKTQSFSTLAGCAVDADKGIIHGVSVITEGEARGHGKRIDSTTLSQVLKVAESHKNGVKVKLNHEETPTLQSTCGTLQNFRIDGKQLRADLNLLKSDDNYGKILELAQKCPEDFGLSIVFSGADEAVGAQKFARCVELYSADLVDRPAANPTGLFSTKPNMNETELKEQIKALEAEIKTLKETKLSVPQDVTDKLTKLAELETKFTAFETKAVEATKLAEKSAKDSLLAEAARDGKVIPLSKETIETTSFSVLEEMVKGLPKNVVPVATKQKFELPSKAEERATALQAKIKENSDKMTQYFAERGFTNQHQAL